MAHLLRRNLQANPFQQVFVIFCSVNIGQINSFFLNLIGDSKLKIMQPRINGYDQFKGKFSANREWFSSSRKILNSPNASKNAYIFKNLALVHTNFGSSLLPGLRFSVFFKSTAPFSTPQINRIFPPHWRFCILVRRMGWDCSDGVILIDKMCLNGKLSHGMMKTVKRICRDSTGNIKETWDNTRALCWATLEVLCVG